MQQHGDPDVTEFRNCFVASASDTFFQVYSKELMMPEKQKCKNVVAYTRISCNHQTGVDDQLKSNRDWIAAQKLPWKIVRWIISFWSIR